MIPKDAYRALHAYVCKCGRTMKATESAEIGHRCPSNKNRWTLWKKVQNDDSSTQ